MKKNDKFEIEITDLSDEGLGIGKKDGFVWFVKDTLPGDTAEAAVTKLKKNYGFARLLRIVRPSEDRAEAPCKIARACGGCQLQAMNYEAQLRFKERKVLNNLRRIGGFSVVSRKETAETAAHASGEGAAETGVKGSAPACFGIPGMAKGEGSVLIAEPIIGMDERFRYRNKAQFPIGKNKEGRPVAGFYAGRTHSIIACEDCLLGVSENRLILDCILDWMNEFHLEPYDEASGKGLLRHVLIRKGFASGQLMVCLVVNAEKLPHAEELTERLLRISFEAETAAAECAASGGRAEAVPNVAAARTNVKIASISYSINREKTNVIMGNRIVGLYGPGYIEDSLRRLNISEDLSFVPNESEPPVTFRISPLSFYQVNPRQTEKLYSTALHYAGLTGKETVWDLYCGIGTISLFLARHAKKVYGVEIIPQAIENARENARLNGIENAEFFVGKAEEVLPAWYEAQVKQAAKKALREGNEQKGGYAEKTGQTETLVPSASEETAGFSEGTDSGKNAPRPLCEPIDVIVVDPPRKGCDERCLETIVKLAPKRIVYVSCDSATLARDLKYLCTNGYELRKVRACDMFGETVHVETVVLLSHKKADSYINVDVEFGEGEGKIPLDNIAKRAAVYKPKERVTYKMIKEYIEEKYGFKVHTAYIAEVKRELGLPMYEASNAVEELKQPRKHPTAEKVEAIKDALRYFGVI